jgi:four helix bundle protein
VASKEKNMAITHYKDLIVWQKAMDLVCLVYQTSKSFPKDELYGLTNQVRRTSCPSRQISLKGKARKSTAEFRQFLSVARGSLAEVETQLLIAQRLKYMRQTELTEIMALHEEISKMTSSLLSKLITNHSQLDTK